MHGELQWQAASYGWVLRVLRNPIYTGSYVYGRRKSYLCLDTMEKKRQKLQEPEDWRVIIPDNHPGYLSWEEFLKNGRILRQNWGKGKALLTGMVYCGYCGRKVNTAYSGTGGIYPVSRCDRGTRNMVKAPCFALHSGFIDRAVVEAFLEKMKPVEMDIAISAWQKAKEEVVAFQKQWARELQRAEYEADRARRQYDKVEPENHLVARSLEERWEEKLKKVEALQKQHEERKKKIRTELTDEDREKIYSLCRHLPWI